MLPRLPLSFQDWSEKVGRSESLTLAAIKKGHLSGMQGESEWCIQSEMSFRRWWERQARAVGGSSPCFKKSFPPFPPLIYSAVLVPNTTFEEITYWTCTDSMIWLLESWEDDKQCLCKREPFEPWVPVWRDSSALWLYVVWVHIMWADAIGHPGEHVRLSPWCKLFWFWSSKAGVVGLDCFWGRAASWSSRC